MQILPGVPDRHSAGGGAAVPSRSRLDGLSILVAEDDFRLARQLEQAILDAGGSVVGPADTVSDALRLLNVERVDGAILDTLLHREVPTLVAERLSDKGVPFVFHADVGLPDALWARFPLTPVCLKAMDAVALVGALADYLERTLRGEDGGDRWPAERRPAN